jgi:3-deoxy-D-manno-octulosonic-acid transferase
MFNFKDIAETFVNQGAARMVRNRDELLAELKTLLDDGTKAEELGDRARALVEKNSGATERNMGYLAKFI